MSLVLFYCDFVWKNPTSFFDQQVLKK